MNKVKAVHNSWNQRRPDRDEDVTSLFLEQLKCQESEMLQCQSCATMKSLKAVRISDQNLVLPQISSKYISMTPEMKTQPQECERDRQVHQHHHPYGKSLSFRGERTTLKKK